jgi:hypothetical protein
MIRRFATITPAFWTGPSAREWRALGVEYHLLALYLFSNPHANQYGLYYLPMVNIAQETGIARPLIPDIFETFKRQTFAQYDEPTEWVFVQKMLLYQLQLTGRELNATSPTVRGVQEFYRQCPPNPFLDLFFECYAETFGLHDRRNHRPLLTVTPSDRQIATEQFARVWDIYPKKESPRTALAAWLAITPLPTPEFTDHAIATIARQRQTPEWLKEGGQFVPRLENWIQQGRWNDEPSELPFVSADDVDRMAVYMQDVKRDSR